MDFFRFSQFTSKRSVQGQIAETGMPGEYNLPFVSEYTNILTLGSSAPSCIPTYAVLWNTFNLRPQLPKESLTELGNDATML